jgi:hypothetical protein
MDKAQDLTELVRKVVADGDYGMTVRTGELLVVYTIKGPRSVGGCFSAPANGISRSSRVPNKRRWYSFVYCIRFGWVAKQDGTKVIFSPPESN